MTLTIVIALFGFDQTYYLVLCNAKAAPVDYRCGRVDIGSSHNRLDEMYGAVQCSVV